jgi:DNA modification methylase
LLRGEFAQLVLTDEPYNVANVGHVTSNADRREFAFAHGEMSREEFARFNRQWMEAVFARLVDGGLFATFIDWRSIDLVIASGRELALDLINVVVWVKTNGGQGSLWRSQHELLPVFKKGAEPHINNVELGRHGRWRSNVWEYDGASSLGSDAREGLVLHPTVKPRLCSKTLSSTSRTAATSSSTASRVQVRRWSRVRPRAGVVGPLSSTGPIAT